MSNKKYSRLPTEPSTTRSRSPSAEEESEDEENLPTQSSRTPAAPAAPLDPRFYPPPPSAAKRAALLFFIAFLFWLAFRLRVGSAKEQIIHADRYSDEYKYRPAASPIITETLKNGKLRVRGAPREARNY